MPQGRWHGFLHDKQMESTEIRKIMCVIRREGFPSRRLMSKGLRSRAYALLLYILELGLGLGLGLGLELG